MQNTEVDIAKYDAYFITPEYHENISKNYFKETYITVDFQLKKYLIQTHNIFVSEAK